MRKKLPIILNRIIAAALTAGAAIHLVLGIWWLAVGFIVLLGAFYLGVSPNSRVRAFRNKSLLSYPLLFEGLFILAISLRVLVFGIYFIPSTSTCSKPLYRETWYWATNFCTASLCRGRLMKYPGLLV